MNPASVIAFLSDNTRLEVELATDTALVASGLLDSLALFRLMMWVEEQIGQPLDPATLDIPAQWATPAEIARFIAARRNGPALSIPPEPTPVSSARDAPASGYTIVRYEPKYAEATARLRALLSPSRDPTLSADFLAWRYARNPCGAGQIYLALSGSDVVGMRGMFETRWETDRGGFAVPCLGDLVIAPGHRDRGLYTRIMRTIVADAAAAGHSHLFSLSANRVSAMGALSMGFRAVAAAEPLQRQLPRVLFHLGRMRAWAVRRDARTEHPLFPRRLGRGLVIENAPRAAAMAQLIERLGHDGRLRQCRDATYLAWRYANPGYAYSFLFSFGSGDTLDGYIVLSRLRRRPRSRSHIIDWEAATQAVAARLADALVRRCRWDEIAAWRLGLDGDKRRILAERGFEPQLRAGGMAGFSTSILVKTLTDDPNRAASLGGRPVFDPRAWDYRPVYSDVC